MAQSINLMFGSLLAGSPIIVTVKSDDGLVNATFHRVKLVINAALSTTGGWKKFVLSSPAGSDDIIRFDVSTALRSVFAQYKHEVVDSEEIYPFVMYNFEAYDEWIINGIPAEKQNVQKYPSIGNIYALMGAFTDRERYLAGESKNVTTFTRKPLTGEVCAKGELFVYPEKPTSALGMSSTITAGPKVKVATLNAAGEQTFEGRSIYVDDTATDRMLFQFVNGFGVVETISAEMLESLESSGDTEVDVVTAPSSFGSPRQNIVRRSNRKNVYKCSSGYVNREWAEWWTNEFLGGDAFRRSGHSQCWVFLDGNWLPCTVTPDDDIKLYNRTKPGLTQIEFEVRVL